MIPLDYIAFYNESGYGQAAFDLISALLQTRQYDIKLTPLNGSISKSFISSKTFSIFENLTKKQSHPKRIQIFHCIPSMQARMPRKEKAIGFATFETFEPPQNWINLLNRMDAVIAPSQFNYKIFAHEGIKQPLYYIPHCFDPLYWNNNVLPIDNHSRFTFMFVGTWKKRKGWPQLIEAYLREFCEKENVQLIIKTDKNQLAIQEIEKIKVTLNLKKDYAPILFERRIFNEEYLPSFYKSANCLVMPTLGEGFGLPGLQCMAVKTPVIVTNFSGCKDYALPENCTLIEPAGFTLQDNMDNIIQFQNKKWPRITIQSIQDSMRLAFSSKEQLIYKADKAYEYVHKNFCYSVAAAAFGKMIERVYSGN